MRSIVMRHGEARPGAPQPRARGSDGEIAFSGAGHAAVLLAWRCGDAGKGKAGAARYSLLRSAMAASGHLRRSSAAR